MRRGIPYGGRTLIAAAALLMAGALSARAALVDLDLYVTYSILQNDQVTPLADGSLVVVIGSGDSINDGMAVYPQNVGTNYLALSTLGDDMILGYVYIGENTFANTGRFFQTFQYNSTNDIGYVYIRYFQTPGPVTGMVYWGQSDVYNLNPTNYGVVTIDAAPLESLVASNYNNFVVIPEPSTAALLALAGGMVYVLRRSRRRSARLSRGRIAPAGGE